MVSQIKEEEPPTSSSSYPVGDPSNNHRCHAWKYDVFLSFRGEDTRKTFVDHLYHALHQRGIFTFKDDERLERGKSITPELRKAIELSRFAIVVFSKTYASSSWCLDELAKIMDCHNNNTNTYMAAQLTVIPIFYDVQPSDVRKQEGHFGEMFLKHDSDKVQIWKQALTDAANVCGWDLKNVANGHEAKCIDIVVKEIRSKLPHTISSVDEVGWLIRSNLQFSSTDADPTTMIKIVATGNGSVCIMSKQNNKFWPLTITIDTYDNTCKNWICANSDENTSNNPDTMFWPVKVESNVITLKGRFGLKSKYNNKYMQYVKEDVEVHGFNKLSEENLLSPYAKYEVEMAKTGGGLVHIKSCYNNKYFTRWSTHHWWIVAGADKPEEDKSKWSCTLFEILPMDGKIIRFRHVQLGHYACLWRLGSENVYDSCLFAGSKGIDKDQCDVFTVID